MKVGQPVIGNAAYCLAHVPDLVRYGSKPRREILKDPRFEARLAAGLRSFNAAAGYPPNQTFIGNLTPDALGSLPRPWYSANADPGAAILARGELGEIVPQDVFYGLLKQADVLEPALVELGSVPAPRIAAALESHARYQCLIKREWQPVADIELDTAAASGSVLMLWLDSRPVGFVRRDDRAEGREDENLGAHTLLEALCTKASGAMALVTLLARHGLEPGQIDFIISCGEEAAGDRYQRGGGGVAKAIGEMCGCTNASGMDVKNFCAAPASALVTAAAMVGIGLYERVAVVAGGSLAKLGMKSEALLRAGAPILDDCLASHAFLVCRDDGEGPLIHIDRGAVGTATIGSSTADEAVYKHMILEPLDALGLKMTDIDKYAPELHNPEIMEHAGSGDVAHKNYRMIAAMAVRAGVIQRSEMQAFIDRIGMVGFAPTQGHIPSGVAYIGHAMREFGQGRMDRVMILSKASLFLNRITELYDGVSFVLETNPGARPR